MIHSVLTRIEKPHYTGLVGMFLFQSVYMVWTGLTYSGVDGLISILTIRHVVSHSLLIVVGYMLLPTEISPMFVITPVPWQLLLELLEHSS